MRACIMLFMSLSMVMASCCAAEVALQRHIITDIDLKSFCRDLRLPVSAATGLLASLEGPLEAEMAYNRLWALTRSINESSAESYRPYFIDFHLLVGKFDEFFRADLSSLIPPIVFPFSFERDDLSVPGKKYPELAVFANDPHVVGVLQESLGGIGELYEKLTRLFGCLPVEQQRHWQELGRRRSLDSDPHDGDFAYHYARMLTARYPALSRELDKLMAAKQLGFESIGEYDQIMQRHDMDIDGSPVA
ncbi:hypothetical protein EBZ39_14295 [bacterium]|nr:hypothetical protein [bacterium]